MADKNKEAQELKGILGEINAAMQEMEAHNKRINDGFKSTKDSLSSIIDIAAQYNSYQTKNKELSADQLKNLSEKLKAEKENLKLSQESLVKQIDKNRVEKESLATQHRNLKNQSAFRKLNEDEKKSLNEIKSKYESITQTLNLQNSTLDQSREILDDIDGTVGDIEKGLDKAAKGAKGLEGLKKVGEALDKVSTPLDGMLNPMNLINKVIGFVVGNVVKLDTELGDAAKSMNMTYSAAAKSRGEMARMANASGDILLNSTHLQESVLSINESLGSNVAFEQMSESFQKDVGFLSKMSHYAGLTAEEANSIAKLTLATGQSAEKFTSELMGQVQASGLQ